MTTISGNQATTTTHGVGLCYSIMPMTSFQGPLAHKRLKKDQEKRSSSNEYNRKKGRGRNLLSTDEMTAPQQYTHPVITSKGKIPFLRSFKLSLCFPSHLSTTEGCLFFSFLNVALKNIRSAQLGHTSCNTNVTQRHSLIY